MKKTIQDLTVRIIGGLIVAAIVGAVGWSMTHRDKNPNETKIVFPKDGATVAPMQSFEGRFAEELDKVDLWLVVQPVNAPNYHPQTSNIPTMTNGKWTGIAYLGESEKKNRGEEFVVHLVSTTPQASRSFREYLSQADNEKEWPGLPELPSGSTVQNNIRVFRK